MQQLYQTTSNSHALMLKITQWRNYSTNIMLSLNWILVLALAHLHYMAAAPVWNNIDWNHLQELNQTICKENSSFYSPRNVETVCTVSALNCTMSELKTAISECIANKHHRQIARKAERMITSALTEKFAASTGHATNCTQCEGYEVKPYKEFIKDLLVLIEQLNTVESEIQLRNVLDNL